MNHLPKILLVFMIGNILSACSSTDKNIAQVKPIPVESTHKNMNNAQQKAPDLRPNVSFSTKYRQLLKENQLREQQIKALAKHQTTVAQKQTSTDKSLNFYIRRLMQDLVSNLQFVNDKTPVAVTDFALLDSGLQTTNLLGYQITESLTHEIHKFGIPIIDFKSTGYIRVTETGDFLLTRNYEELSGNLPIRYVFTGTLTKHEKGYLVNAKVLGVESKAVVGSAQSFIPNSVANSLLMSTLMVEPEKEKRVVSLSN